MKEGVFGSTFQGTMQFVPCHILSLSEEGLTKYTEIAASLAYLSKLHHPLLLGILAAANSEAQLKYLVEAQPVQGSLRRRLDLEGGLPSLQWATRFKIAGQCVSALLMLATLHLERPFLPWILLRSEDVRLANEYDAKISLLGALEARADLFAPGNQGYLAPELRGEQQDAEVTEKAAVFSLGVLLGELLTGQRAVLTKPAGRHLSNALLERHHFFSDHDSMVDEMVCREWPKASRDAFLEVIITCLRPDAAGRPTLTEVFRRLKAVGTLAVDSCAVCYSSPASVLTTCNHKILCRVCYATSSEGGLGCPLCGSPLSK